jgi:hypothetical protein
MIEVFRNDKFFVLVNEFAQEISIRRIDGDDPVRRPLIRLRLDRDDQIEIVSNWCKWSPTCVGTIPGFILEK